MTSELEVFAPVIGFVGYRVSNLGRVQSCLFRGKRGPTETWTDRKYTLTPKGDPFVGLHRNGKTITKLVSHLVLEAFHGPRPKFGEAKRLHDKDKTNNRADNLKWVTGTEKNYPRGVLSNRAKLDDEKAMQLKQARLEGKTYRELGKQFDISAAAAQAICTGRTWRHTGTELVEQCKAVKVPHHGNIKCSETDIQTIRARRKNGERLQPIADSYNLDISTISRICSGDRWAHL